MKTMLAARYLGPHRLQAEEIPLPELAEEEALVEIEACGFCGSDINIVAGTHPRARAPLTLGHELSGTIAEIRSQKNSLQKGDKVTAFPLISCGRCHACTHDNSHVCSQLRLYGIDLDGGMAQFVKLPVSSLVRLPDEMPARIGAMVEPLAVAVHGASRTTLRDVNLVVVLGAGPIGLLTALVVKESGVSNVVVSDVNPERRALARKIGLNPIEAGEDLRQQVMELSNNDGADVLFECAGHPSTAIEMTTIVRSRGVIVNLGVFKHPVAMDMQAVNFKELEVRGSRVYTIRDFETAINLAAKLPLDRIVTHAYRLQDDKAAFEQFRSGQVCKALILPMERAIESA
jgi:(R,R)-butanediol dehydrogenase / meso-butanediol dehydrogenase / diacetyl reductase